MNGDARFLSGHDSGGGSPLADPGTSDNLPGTTIDNAAHGSLPATSATAAGSAVNNNRACVPVLEPQAPPSSTW